MPNFENPTTFYLSFNGSNLKTIDLAILSQNCLKFNEFQEKRYLLRIYVQLKNLILMTRNQELQKIIKEQKKDKSSVVVYPHISKSSCDNPFQKCTFEQFIYLTESANLSDREILSLFAVSILGWPKVQVGRAMGKSHTAISKYIKSAKKKICIYFNEL